MATPRAGRNAAIYLDTSSAGTGSATPVSLMNKWSLDQATDQMDVTAFGAATKSYVTGIPDTKGSFGGFWDADDSSIYNVIGSSVARKLYLYPDRANNASTYFYTNAFVDLSFEASTDGVVAINGNFVGAAAGTWKTA